MKGINLPVPLELYGKAQCTMCGKIITKNKAERSKRWPNDKIFSQLCPECVAMVDKRCTCSRPCANCEYFINKKCGGCRMPPCEECEANQFLREVK